MLSPVSKMSPHGGPMRAIVSIATFASLLILYGSTMGGSSRHVGSGGLVRHDSSMSYNTRREPRRASALEFKDGNKIVTTAEDRVLVVYAFSYTENAAANFRFFLRTGFEPIAILHGREVPVDYIVMINGDQGTVSDQEITDAAAQRGASLSIVKRRNHGMDFCGYHELFAGKLPGVKLRHTYTYFVLLNASVRGPFLPAWFKGNWIEAFLVHIDDDCKLVGTTINCWTPMHNNWAKFHIQSMVLATDAVGFEVLLDRAMGCYDDKLVIVDKCEVAASQEMLRAGYGIKALQYSWGNYVVHMKDVGGPEVERRCNAVSYKKNGDPNFEGMYASGNVDPWEVIFFKANRNVTIAEMERRSWLTDNYKSQQ